MGAQQSTTAHSEQIPLSTLYLQIQHATTPLGILGLAAEDTIEAEIRDAYRALALRIHPDKAPEDGLRALHTELFQKVQDAFEQLLRVVGVIEDNEEPSTAKSKRLPDTAESLRARNVAFREALQREREMALIAKKEADAAKQARMANLLAKDERLAAKRETRAVKAQAMKAKHDAEVESKIEQREKRKAAKHGRKKAGTRKGMPMTMEEEQEESILKNEMRDSSIFRAEMSWEEETEHFQAFLEAKRAEAKAAAEEEKLHPKPKKAKRAPRDKPTSATARPKWDPAVDERLVSHREIRGRWDKALLSGGRRGGTGSLSLSEKKRRENNGAAKGLRDSLALVEEAEALIKPALVANKTFSGMVQDELMAEAFIGAEGRADGLVEKRLRTIDGQIREMYLLEDQEWEGLRRGMELLEFVG